jgi:hypothetical protein
MQTETKVATGYTMEIFQDEDPANPRTEWDNLGTMVCFHGRYNLGDEHDYDSNDFDTWEELKKQIIKDEDPAVILPIYLYDHSGITISTSPFGCRWDSGQIGFIYLSKQRAREEYGFKRMSAKMKERITNYLDGEVDTYDQYLTGEVYGFDIMEGDEVIESVSGYYGEESAIEAANDMLKYYNEKHPITN